MEIRPYRTINRKITKQIKVGNVGVGGSVDTGPYPLAKSMYLTLNVSF